MNERMTDEKNTFRQSRQPSDHHRRPENRSQAGKPSGKPGRSFDRKGGKLRGGNDSFKKAAVQQKATPARVSALTAIREVLDQGAYVSEAVNRQLSQSTFPQNDRRFCTALVYGTLENLMAIDHILDAFIEDINQLNPIVRHILRMSVCQKAFMDKIPDNAIADEAVKLTRQMDLEYLTGFVNGVLRNYFREPEKVTWPDEGSEPAAYLSLRYSMPQWIVDRLISGYGLETAKTVLTHRPVSHDMTIRPNLTHFTTDDSFEEAMAKKVWTVRSGRVPHAYHISGAMQIARDSDYLAGAFSIQNEASMLCAQLTEAKPGMSVLDACAAPGGKTAYIAEMMQGSGRVYAWDLHEHRVALLNAMKKRLQLDNIRTAAHDARVIKEDFIRRMDICLVDAPCSGLGVINDKPDIKYNASGESADELVLIQQDILNTCSQYVRTGGLLVYSTCTILSDENEKMCQWFLEQHPDFQMEPLPEWANNLFPNARKTLGLQLLPGIDGDEGFYIARFRRIG